MRGIPGAELYSKIGWYGATSAYSHNVYNDAGIVVAGGVPYAFAVFTDSTAPNGDQMNHLMMQRFGSLFAETINK